MYTYNEPRLFSSDVWCVNLFTICFDILSYYKRRE